MPYPEAIVAGTCAFGCAAGTDGAMGEVGVPVEVVSDAKRWCEILSYLLLVRGRDVWPFRRVENLIRT